MRITILIFTALAACSTAAKNSTVTKLHPASKPGEFRGKRTLYNIGNYAYTQQRLANDDLFRRRISNYNYNDQRDFYQPDSYSGQFGGPPHNYVPDASNHLPEQPPYYQPQYLEAPEPIIEIIIKESNETLPEPPSQPHFVQKKKKEQVQVFYVNYKKGHNNKLQLENPIPALSPQGYNQNQHEEEEEEEIVYQATPAPRLKTTTLRTIIHPDSEKFHSNSGIHVSFNAEDKYQNGHQLQEHNEGSEIQPVVAVPQHQQQNFRVPIQQQQQQQNTNHFNNQRYQSQHRQDYSRSQSHNSNYKSQNYQNPPTHLNPFVNHYQQLPQSNPPPLPFRSFPSQQQQQQQQQQQPQQQQHPQSSYQQNNYHRQQITHLTPRNPPFNHQYSTPQFPPSQHGIPQFPPQSQKQQIQFPSESKNQIKSHVHYQPLKYRPQPINQHKPIPIPLHSIHSDAQQQSFNRPLPFGPPSPAPPPQFHQSQPDNKSPYFRPKPSTQLHSQPINIQHQFQQNKYFPPGPIGGAHNGFDQLQNNNAIRGGLNQQQNSGSHEGLHQLQNSGYNQIQNSGYNQIQNSGLNQLQNSGLNHLQNSGNTEVQSSGLNQFQIPGLNQDSNSGHFGSNGQHNFNIPFLGNVKSELVKSVPRFEQHITETIGGTQSHFGPNFSGQQSSINTQPIYNGFTSQSNQNSVIQTVPSPNLGPTTPASQQHESPTPQFAAYSSTPSPQFGGNFVSQQTQFPSSTPKPQFQSGSSTSPAPQYYQQNNEPVQIVTPITPTQAQYNRQHEYIRYNHDHVQPQIIPNSQPIQQKLPPPGQSVSTIHTDALREIEQLKSNYYAQQNSNQDQRVVEISGRNKFSVHQSVSVTQLPENHRYQSTSSSAPSSTTTTTTTTETPTTTEMSSPKPNVHLPDEVPDDLRQQLLSSGILDNADISVLDYDKIGDTAIENLPPEHLAHFYGAGGGSQISESNKVLSVVKPNGDKVSLNEKRIEKSKDSQTLPKRENVDLKVVRFDSMNQKSVTDKYIRQDSTVLPAVDISNPRYNRYLPLKVNGAQFPIPEAQELRGKKVSSVVVLAPVDSLQNVEDSPNSESRQERGLSDTKRIKFIAGDSLKILLKKPTRENFKRWLDKEAKTDIDFQSVVLLVAKNNYDEQEIYMYDIATKEINKLSGALSSAFVNVAEDNASAQDIDNASITDSGIVEKMTAERKDDMSSAGSSIHETIAKFSSKIQSRKDDELHPVFINSGYSVIRK